MKTTVFLIAAIAMAAYSVRTSQSLDSFERRDDKVKSIVNGHSAQQPDPTAAGYYDRKSCPAGFNCVEVAGLPMWVDHSQAHNCSGGGGFTCAFGDSTTATAFCPPPELDGTSATVFMKHGGNHIDYSSYKNPNVVGTFGPYSQSEGTSEITVSNAFLVTAFIACVTYT